MAPVNATEKLQELRKLMKENSVDVYIVPSEDSHSSEYIAHCDGRRAFLTGFTGSAGCAVVTTEKAALATDGRYFNQATQQLDSNWELLKQGLENVPTWQEWSADQAAGGKVVAVDPTLLASGAARKLSERIVKSTGKDLLPLDENLVDKVWGSDRPPRPMNLVALQEEKYAGKGVGEKLEQLRKELEKKKSPGFVVSMLDEIAWLFNLRGSDIPYNPVFFAYAIVTPETATLYIDDTKVSPEIQNILAENHVAMKPYEAIFNDSKALSASVVAAASASDSDNSTPSKFLISNKASWALKRALGGEDLVDEVRSPIGDAKAVKNDVELEGMRACQVRDGAALIEYFAWLEDQLVNKKAKVDEVEGAEKLESLRAKHKDFIGLSFDTISSTGANAAIIHYTPEKGICPTIDPAEVYLCDSGGQYRDGTTDTTRTVHFGTPKDEEIHAYTLVLKGNISLDMAIFPKGTTGFALDILARQFLWNDGLDYRHGTGHGVGSYLNVHEGPIGIGTRVQYTEVPLAPGNVTSIEPGFYEDGSYGIRIENMAIVKEIESKLKFGDKPFLGFEHITMVPYCRKLIDCTLLTAPEKKWLNDHHAEIFEKTKDYFKYDELTMSWLKRETHPLE
ncbi:hypothetical protein MKZ38_006039 [Zalerion maritima]|uniref:Probable Xaa-Pro aminopeptidase P n=1 Tax=Zalerion maritima TaxID=339359 RepID=A0AAD5RKM1_9PEZI|nr:hypothetical protein MKZ38_006039 [Zalerion maritima]